LKRSSGRRRGFTTKQQRNQGQIKTGIGQKQTKGTKNLATDGTYFTDCGAAGGAAETLTSPKVLAHSQ
jgi:hypothetical protein